MKMFKRMVAVMLAVVMMMGLGVTSMAASVKSTPYTAIVTIIDENNVAKQYSVPVEEKSSYSGYEEIENNGEATAFDAINVAVNDVKYHKVQYVQYNGDTGKWESIDKYGFAIDAVNGKEGTYDAATGKYHYWELLINGQVADNYATNYLLSEGYTNITLRWATY